jgi:hypothetical protein
MTPVSGTSPTPDRPFDQHSSSCQDHNTMVYDDECIGECHCRPSEDVKPPNAYELWWCEWCGEEAHEGSDPCQRCGEPATIRKYIAIDTLEEIASSVEQEVDRRCQSIDRGDEVTGIFSDYLIERVKAESKVRR